MSMTLFGEMGDRIRDQFPLTVKIHGTISSKYYAGSQVTTVHPLITTCIC